MPKIVCVVPSIRPAQMESFRKAWAPLFEKHEVSLIVVHDGEKPWIDHYKPSGQLLATSLQGFVNIVAKRLLSDGDLDLFCRHTDAVRNIGFVAAACLNPDFVLTLDDDVVPLGVSPIGYDEPIQTHLDAISKRVPISWMNTAHDTDLYLRGFPYGIRDEAPVMLSHGVWVGTPDFDGETQLRLERTEKLYRVWFKCGQMSDQSPPFECPCGKGCQMDGSMVLSDAAGVPYSLSYFVGPIPRGVNFPLCGMNVMVCREALPYFYFAPMGPDSGLPNLHRFADIFMGIFLKKEFDIRGWACYTGASTVLHTRASDARKNVEQEKLGREWMENMRDGEEARVMAFPPGYLDYFQSYADKRERYAKLIQGILEGKS